MSILTAQLQWMKVTAAAATVLAVACGYSAIPMSILTTYALPRTAPVCLVAGCLLATPAFVSVILTSIVTAPLVLVAGCLCRPAHVSTSVAVTALKVIAPTLAVTHGSSLASTSASISPVDRVLKTTMEADQASLMCIWHRYAVMLKTATAAAGLKHHPLPAGHGVWVGHCKSWPKRMRPRLSWMAPIKPMATTLNSMGALL